MKNLSIALMSAALATAAGCAADSPGSTDDPTQDPGNPDDPTCGGDGCDNPTPKTISVDGTYAMHSTFDLATNAPGTVGDVVNTIIAATDDPEDPTKWVVDLALSQMSGGVIKSALQSAEPYVVGYLNDQVLSFAPSFVSTMVTMGKDFGQMSKNFGTVETLAISGATSVHTVTGAHLKIDTNEQDLMFSAYGMDNVVVNGVGITADASTGKVQIAEHKLPLAYGKILHIGLDAMIIPALSAGASDLNSLFENLVDCDAVGQAIDDYIGFGGASTYASACHLGLTAGANLIYSKINAIDATALTFDIAGTVRAVDSNSDGKADKLQTGAWSGMLSYGSTPSPLAPATFYGQRQ